ncbi:LysR substrate-binding domain protein [Clostridium sp. MSTE9]|uniref:LysR family transcriptional regulator n=1 Tax=Clostridium sp. (strain MSTE9) TaxID=1105031 RepID=UPI00026F4105|nr:LysR substrate-binding domain-containing protein [Clostridium sp. MSTE9]EJF42059.1 LysR substrate-binding domain protein [Clostridium sp. MSTE9]
MDLKKYKVFLASADLGSFTKAAAQLDYTPSGVTHMMNALEEELGFQILTRGKNGVQLTENGKRLVPILRELLHLEEEFSQTVSEMNGLNSGTIRIGSYSSIAVHWLPKIIKSFQHDYPNIRIKLMEGIRQEVVSWLEEQKIDLGFMSYQPGMKFDWIPLRDDPMIAVLPLDHPLAKEKAYPLKNCESENFIMPACGSDFDVVELFRNAKISPKIRYETFENYAALSMIECGLGMSVMNELVTKGRICNVIKLPLEPEEHISLGIAVPNTDKLPPAAKKFIGYCEREF